MVDITASKRAGETKVSYWIVFRSIFLIFSLYFLGDAFYRWDGFRYYASFSEFIPSMALAIILWSIVAVLAAIITWLSFRSLEWFGQRMAWRIKMEHMLLYLYFSILLGIPTVIYRRSIYSNIPIISGNREILLIGVILVAILLLWLFWKKAEKWISIIHERTTPLVWLFGILVVLSVPIVVYHTWIKQPDNLISQEIYSPVESNKNRPNIILVTFDSLTARDMSAYGYRKDTTPFISKWSDKAYLFNRVEAESNYTAPTTASLMTGDRLWTHRIFQPHGFNPDKSDVESLPYALKNNGYYNIAFIANPLASVKALGVANSFEIAPVPSELSTPASLFGSIDKFLYQNFGEKIRMYDWVIRGDFVLSWIVDLISRNIIKTIVPPENAFNKFLSVIDHNPPEPFFAWIHLYPPHHPYLPPEPYMGFFDSSNELRSFRSQWRVYKPRKYTKEMQPAFERLRTRYDEFIRYCDKQFENFIAQLAIRNKLENTVIILSADHGESFEHNYIGHGTSYMYEQVTHIPLIIKVPSQTQGRIINDLIEQIDIPPTILDLADIPVPSWMEGRSLVQTMRGESLPEKVIFSMSFENTRSHGQKITKGTIAAWEGDYKLIYYLGKDQSLLFNLKQDPGELNDLFLKEPEIGQRLLNIIKNNLNNKNDKINKEK